MPKWLKIIFVILICIIIQLPINQIWKVIEPGLSYNWWQGVAGIAQIIAGFLAIETIRQAERERRESVAPDWGISSFIYKGSDPIMCLKNIGFGAARKVKFEYQPNKHIFNSIRFKGYEIYGIIDSVSPDEEIELRINILGPQTEGSFTITCMSRFGEEYKWQVDFDTASLFRNIYPIKP